MITRLAQHLSYFAPAAVMSAWATVMFHTIASGHINRLLSPLFRSYVFIAAIMLLVLSALYVLLYQPAAEVTPTLAPNGRLRQTGRWFVLLIPVLAAAVLSPAALSSTTLANRAATASPTANMVPLASLNQNVTENVANAMAADPNQPVPMEVTDLVIVANTPAQIKSFSGRKIRTVGMISTQGGTTKLVRWIMWCCAADAQPASVVLTGNTAGDWKDNQWYEIVGTAQFPSTLGRVIPQIDVDSISSTKEPDEPYLSP